MNNIINSENSTNTTIKKYEFNKLEVDDNEYGAFDENIFKDTIENTEIQKESIESDKQPEPSTELLEKIDTLTSQIVTLQMELDNQKKSFDEKLELETKSAFELGKKEGIKETTATLQNENDELKTQLIRSITLLDEQKNQLDDMFKNIEEDLVQSAILIAKKVIKKEIEHNSTNIAKSIASSLIDTLKSATMVKIKVNPADFKQISEHFNQDSIKIEEDIAISPGGVVILSDTTNVDGTISTRLNKAIDLIGKE